MKGQDGIADFKNDVFSGDSVKLDRAFKSFVAIGGEEVISFLINLLDQEDTEIRNKAAIALMDIGDDKAVQPLFNAINKKQNFNKNGTLVYALQVFDCKNRLVDLFSILFFQGYEARMGAITILNSQIFEFSKDILQILQQWKNIQMNPGLCPQYESSKEDIKAMVDCFEAYIRK